jgi:membrane protein implicated in regulation of membrane protease activity
VKRLKRIALLVAVGFLAFAPPGTLIVVGLLVAGSLGGRWALLAGALVFVGVALVWVVRRHRRRAAASEPSAGRGGDEDPDARRG